MRRIWFVRHGPTHRRDLVGWSDLPADLSDTAALARLAAFLPSAPIISSDLSRAVTTADAIQRARPRLPHAAGLREINFGDWELKSAAEIEAEHPELGRAYWDDPITIRPPGGETLDEVAARVATVLDPLADLPDLIVVAHFGVIISQLHRALGGPVRNALAHRIDNLSVTEIVIAPEGPRAGRINHRP